MLVKSNLVLLLLLLVTTARAEEPELKVTTEKDVVYGKAGDIELKLDLTRPAGKGPFPAIVCIHGGGWMGGKRQDLGPLSTLLSQHGYVAVTVSYRFAPQHKFPAQIEDCKAAVRWLRANAAKYEIDKDRLGAIGFSAGGHLASLLGTMDKNDGLEGDGGNPNESSWVQAVVNFFGPTDLTINDWSKTAYEGILVPVIGARFEEHPELYKRMSSATYATKDDAPTLFFHGAKDDLVGVRHSVDMTAKLKGLGIKSRAEKLFPIDALGIDA